MKINVKQLTMTAMLLAICIASQFFKNFSVYITGPIINAALIIAVFYCGLASALMLAAVTPITAFIITGSPVMSAVPAIIPCVIAGNAVLVIVTHFTKGLFGKKIGVPVSIVLGSVVKAALMGLLISVWLLPAYLPEKMGKMMHVLKMQFSVVQLTTALIGGVYAILIMAALSRTEFNPNKES